MKGSAAFEVLSSTRFGLFAAAHLLWSLGCSFFTLRLLDTLSYAALCARAAVVMLAYLPLGWAVARLARWPRPGRRESLWAVLLPALIAWGWAGTAAVCLYGAPDAFGLGAMLALPALWLASPSLLLTVTILAALARLWESQALAAGAAIFWAGLLPGLLFWLGSVFGGGKRRKKRPEAA